MRDLIRSAVTRLYDWRLDVLHLAGNAVLFAAAALWLLIPEARIWQLVFAAISGLCIVFAFASLHSGTLAHGLTPSPATLSLDFRKSVRHIPWFTLLLVVLLLLMNYFIRLSERGWEISGYFFTRLPHFLQVTIGEEKLNTLVEWKFTVLIWLILPAIFLPFLSTTSAFGLRKSGMVAAFRCYAHWRYWLSAAIAAVVGIWLPHTLMTWTPGHGLRGETISLILRLAASYVIVIVTWIMISAIVGSFLRKTAPVENTGRDAAA